jgi:hypothetical protein
MKKILLIIIDALEKISIFLFEKSKFVIQSFSFFGAFIFIIESFYYLKNIFLLKKSKETTKLIKNRKINRIYFVNGWNEVMQMEVLYTTMLSYHRISRILEKSKKTTYFVIELYAKEKENPDKTFYILLSPLHAVKYYRILTDIKKATHFVYTNNFKAPKKYQKYTRNKYPWNDHKHILFTEYVKKILIKG